MYFVNERARRLVFAGWRERGHLNIRKAVTGQGACIRRARQGECHQEDVHAVHGKRIAMRIDTQVPCVMLLRLSGCPRFGGTGERENLRRNGENPEIHS